MRRLGLVLVFLLAAAACGREGGSFGVYTPAPATPEPTEAFALPTEAPSPSPTLSPTPTPIPTVAPTMSPVATAAPVCRNSTRATCGDFRFDPGVGTDQQVTVQAEVSPANPKAGQAVTFTLRASDQDSHLLYLGTYRFSKDGPGVVADDFPGNCPIAYGPWDPPKASSGSVTKKLTHTYTKAGTYKALFSFYSHSYANGSGGYDWPDQPPGDHDGLCIDPLASAGQTKVTVVVTG